MLDEKEHNFKNVNLVCWKRKHQAALRNATIIVKFEEIIISPSCVYVRDHFVIFVRIFEKNYKGWRQNRQCWSSKISWCVQTFTVDIFMGVVVDKIQIKVIFWCFAFAPAIFHFHEKKTFLLLQGRHENDT